MRSLFVSFLFLYSIHAASAQQVKLYNSNGKLSYPAAALDSLVHFSRYNAIIYGETHTVFFEPEFKLNLIRQLNDTYGIRDVFMEMGYSAAWLFNQYLQTGDSALLDHPRPVYTWRKGAYMDFWKALFLYNQSLPEGRRIKIHGVDFERSDVFKTLLMLRPRDVQVPASLQPVLQQVVQYAKDTVDNPFSKTFVNQLKDVCSVMKEHIADTRALYGANFPVVENIINNNSPHTPHVPRRNETMFQNMEKAIAAEHIEQFAGFFGNAHTYLQSDASLPNRINALPHFNGKVLSISEVCFNAYNLTVKSCLEYVGLVKYKNIRALRAKYLSNDWRAVLVKNSDIDIASMKKSSDYTMFANDTLSR